MAQMIQPQNNPIQIKKTPMTRNLDDSQDPLKIFIQKTQSQRQFVKEKRHEVLNFINSAKNQANILSKGAVSIKNIAKNLDKQRDCIPIQNYYSQLICQQKSFENMADTYKKAYQKLKNLNYDLSTIKTDAKGVINKAINVQKRLEKYEEIAQEIRQGITSNEQFDIDIVNSEVLLSQIQKCYNQVPEIDQLINTSQQMEGDLQSAENFMMDVVKEIIGGDNYQADYQINQPYAVKVNSNRTNNMNSNFQEQVNAQQYQGSILQNNWQQQVHPQQNFQGQILQNNLQQQVNPQQNFQGQMFQNNCFKQVNSQQNQGYNLQNNNQIKQQIQQNSELQSMQNHRYLGKNFIQDKPSIRF